MPFAVAGPAKEKWLFRKYERDCSRMPNSTNPNLELLEAVVARLGPLVDEVVFLGGCATGLLLSERMKTVTHSAAT